MIITIFYSKTTGEIYSTTLAENEYDYNRFGKFANEMAQILDILYIEGDESLYMSLKNYYVDIESKTLVYKQPQTISYLNKE